MSVLAATGRVFLLLGAAARRTRLSPSCFQASAQTRDVQNDRGALVFNDAKEVFGHRSTKELWRAYLVLRACGIEPLVRRSYSLLCLGEKWLGPSLLGKLISPFYWQFVAGDCEKEVDETSKVLYDVGVNVLICPMVETDVGDQESGEELFDDNLRKTLELIGISSRRRLVSDQLRPACLTKMTAHISSEVLVNVSTAYENLSFEERLCAVKSLSAEMKRLRQPEAGVAGPEDPFGGLALSRQDSEALGRGLVRLVQIGELSRNQNLILAVDAEYTYANPAISLLTLALMATFNDRLPVIWNTYQCYLKSTPAWLKHDLRIVESLQGVSAGLKLVRGAYLERERELARTTGEPDPVHETYALTNQAYDDVLDYVVGVVASSAGRYQAMAATHNEASVLTATRLMQQHGIPNSSPDLLFAQTYGMAENISVPIAKAGYSVYKCVPCGHTVEVLRYLSRRANENRAVLMGARRERALLSQELRRRVARTR